MFPATELPRDFDTIEIPLAGARRPRLTAASAPPATARATHARPQPRCYIAGSSFNPVP